VAINLTAAKIALSSSYTTIKIVYSHCGIS